MGIVNMNGFNKKMKRLQSEFAEIVALAPRDAAAFIAAKLRDDILNGPPGMEYPKTGYPTNIGPGQKGFVGVASGFLKSSVTIKQKDKYFYSVFADPSAAPIEAYYKEIAEWSERKYGMNYIQITVAIYGDMVVKKMVEEVRKMIAQQNQGKAYKYKNPFPA